MRKNLFSLLSFAFLFSMVAFYSCKKVTNEEENATSTTLYRDVFISNKTTSEVKSDYASITEAQKRALWVSKIEQLSKQNLPEAHKTLIASLKTEISKPNVSFNMSNPIIKNLAIHLAEITPAADFYVMFGELQNYQYNERFVGTEISTELVNEIKKATNITVQVPLIESRWTCNCSWTCSGSSGGCTRTSYGCGFLWTQACDGRDF
jgi:hypothetical protein